MVWPFSKKEPLHPLVDRFSKLTSDKRVLEWFENVSLGYPPSLPLDIGLQVKEAMDLSYTITSMVGLPSSTLIQAAKKSNFAAISDAVFKAEASLERRVKGASPEISRIIDWANKYDLPDLTSVDTMAYKETGVPRDLTRLQKLRYLFIDSNFGIEDIPEEVAHLPFLQAIGIPGNRIKSIPRKIYSCISLQRLDLEDNEITRLEDGIHNLANVHTIDLSGNKLSYITSDIAKMPSLRKLDISGQRVEIDIMRARDTPLPQASLSALYALDGRIDMKY